jgi:hypothetical protein
MRARMRRGARRLAGVRVWVLFGGVMRSRRTFRRARGGPPVSGWRVGALNDDVARAGIGLAGGEGEVVGRAARDLEHRLVRSDPDRAHLPARDAAAATDERQQPARVGAVVGAQIDAECDPVAGKLRVALTKAGLAAVTRAAIAPGRLDRHRAHRLARRQPVELARHEPAQQLARRKLALDT